VAFELDAVAVLERLQVLADALPTVQAAVLGIPETWAAQLTAAVTLAGQDVAKGDDEVAGTIERDTRFLVQFGYSTDGDEAAAELALAAAVDAFLPAVRGDAEMQRLLAGLTADAPMADTVEYQLFASQEVRLYPVLVRGQQWGTY
jgi:alpha-D-ribose 1-methylphosphonate 5-triphosphate synthase subunit PhnG